MLAGCAGNGGSSTSAAAPDREAQPGSSAPATMQQDTADSEKTEADSSPDSESAKPVSIRPAVQAFDIVNDLPVAVKLDVSEVDSYDWNVGGTGRPDDRAPRGFVGVIKSGARMSAAFNPNSQASGAPFRVEVNAWTPANAEVVTASKPIGSVSFDKIYICTIKGLPVPCNVLSTKDWMGWGFRVDNSGAIENNYFWMCGRTRTLGNYIYDNVTRRAQVRLACPQKSGDLYGNVAVIEDAPPQ